MSQQKKHPNSKMSEEQNQVSKKQKTDFDKENQIIEELKSKDSETDFLSAWINNPGLEHLAVKILGYLDTKSLARCKTVAKVWKELITCNKSLLLVQIHQLTTFPINFKRIIIRNYSVVNNYFRFLYLYITLYFTTDY